MFFRTVPLRGYNKLLVLGCFGPACPSSTTIRLREFIEDAGLDSRFLNPEETPIQLEPQSQQ